jgi:hypothetical protein
VAYHEAGHAVATLLGFGTVRLPEGQRPPAMPIKAIEVFTPENPHLDRLDGICHSQSTYSSAWPAEHRIAIEWREAMEWNIVIFQAGGIAEAIYRGERRKHNILRFAMRHCGCSLDQMKVEATLADLHTLTGRRHSEHRFVERTRALLLMNWPAIRALAEALTEAKRLEGEQVDAIIAPYLPRA